MGKSRHLEKIRRKKEKKMYLTMSPGGIKLRASGAIDNIKYLYMYIHTYKFTCTVYELYAITNPSNLQIY